MVACTEGPGHKHRLRKSGTQLSMTLVVCPLLSLWCGQGCYFSKSPCPYHICNLLNIQWHCKIPLYHTQDEIWHDYGELKISMSSRNQDLQLLWWQGNPTGEHGSALSLMLLQSFHGANEAASVVHLSSLVLQQYHLIGMH